MDDEPRASTGHFAAPMERPVTRRRHRGPGPTPERSAVSPWKATAEFGLLGACSVLPAVPPARPRVVAGRPRRRPAPPLEAAGAVTERGSLCSTRPRCSDRGVRAGRDLDLRRHGGGPGLVEDTPGLTDDRRGVEAVLGEQVRAAARLGEPILNTD